MHITDLIPRNVQHKPTSDIIWGKHWIKWLVKTDVWEVFVGMLNSLKKKKKSCNPEL